MATFTNFATLSYNGGSTNSNTVTGEILETVSALKTAVVAEYSAGSQVTYIISLVNSGPVAVTGLEISDNLGGYSFGETTVYPLAYTDGSVRYYVGGVLQAAPAVVAGPPLVISSISVPAGGNALVIYQAEVTEYAPLTQGSQIENTATISGGGLTAALTVNEAVTAEETARLSINKALSPAVITENGQLTYTFTIENTGNTAAVSTDNIILTDVFDPALSGITVTFEGAAWTQGTNYTYDEQTGEFASVAGEITVPAATYTQNEDGTITVTPGSAVLTVTGTV